MTPHGAIITGTSAAKAAPNVARPKVVVHCALADPGAGGPS
jgi:hypothetical protein